MKTSLLCLAVVVLPFVGAAEPAPRRPNILVMVSDDHRYDALGVVQRERGDQANYPFFQTPQLDRLASTGIRFRNAFVVHSLCSPSRATMLSGLHTHEHGITFNEQPFTSTNTWPHVLGAAGWRTGYFGKWHMGSQRERPGFQEVATFLNQGVYTNCPFVVNGKDTPSDGWVDDVTTTYAIDFMRANKDKPFAMYVGFKTPHDRRRPADRHAATYAGVTLTKPKTWNLAAPWWKAQAGWDWQKRHADRVAYFQTLAGLDDNVGRLLDTLDELKLAEDTLVFYMGDNGYYLGEHGLGDKRTAYEESLRIPYLVRYPRVSKPGLRDEMVLNLDVTATILDVCGLKASWTQRGRSLVPLLSAGDAAPAWRSSFLYENYRDPAYPDVTFDQLAVRTDTHKLMVSPEHPEWTLLFDLKADPLETNNLATDPASAALLAKMQAELERLKQEFDYVTPPPGEMPKKKGQPKPADP